MPRGAENRSAIWRADASRWSLTHRLYMVALIGEPGLSAPSRPPLDSDAYALWLDHLLGELAVDAAAFVGVSLGGQLATDYAIRRPGRVQRLALRAPAAPTPMPFGDRGTRLALRFALGPGSIPDPVIDYMLLIRSDATIDLAATRCP